MFREVEQTVRAQPGFEPWTQAYDIDRAPDFLLPWLGQAVGVRVRAGDSPAVQRQMIRAEAGFARGRPTSMISAVAATLTGAQRVRLTERSSDAWTELITTDPAETPSPSVTAAAALEAKVAGIVLTVSVASVPLIDEMVRPIDSITGTIDTMVISDVN